MFRLCFDPDSLYIIDCKYCSCLQSYTLKVYCLYCLGLSFKGTNLNMLNSLLNKPSVVFLSIQINQPSLLIKQNHVPFGCNLSFSLTLNN